MNLFVEPCPKCDGRKIDFSKPGVETPCDYCQGKGYVPNAMGEDILKFLKEFAP